MTSRRAAAALAGVVALAAPSPAGASDDPAQLAAAVTRDVVHVDPGARGRLSDVEAGQLRLRIVRRAIGRVRILVVPPATASGAGGVRKLAGEVAEEGRLRGALVVVAGRRAAVATSYDSRAAARAVPGTIGGPLAPALTEGVDRIARADPGPGDDRGAAAAAPPPSIPDVPATPDPGDVPDDFGIGDAVDDVGNAFQLAVFGVGGAVALLVLTPLVLYGLRVRRARREGEEDLEIDCAAARDELIAIGESVRELDIDAEMPGASPAGREALARAVELYGRADRELAKANTRRRLQRAQATLAQARSEADSARSRL
jgi:hypothetical protein